MTELGVFKRNFTTGCQFLAFKRTPKEKLHGEFQDGSETVGVRHPVAYKLPVTALACAIGMV